MIRAALHHALAQAQAGQGQVVALAGDAGVGKSRLVCASFRILPVTYAMMSAYEYV